MDNGLRPPAPFSTAAPGSNPSDVARNRDDWLDEFDTFMVASEKNEKDEVIQSLEVIVKHHKKELRRQKLRSTILNIVLGVGLAAETAIIINAAIR